MTKFDKLKTASNNVAQQILADYAAKIEVLTVGQLNGILADLPNSKINKSELNELLSKVQAATDKNKVLKEYMSKSTNVCQAVIGILAKI